MKREWALLPVSDWKNILSDPQEQRNWSLFPAADKD
jgi:hypothetical protein